MTVKELKEQRNFLKFVFNIKYKQENLENIRRLGYITPQADTVFRCGSNGAYIWKTNQEEIKNLIDRISLEIIKRNKNIRNNL
jgi:precorrin-2 methylase